MITCRTCRNSYSIQFNSIAMTNSDIYTDQLAPYGNMATMVNWGHPVSFS